MQKAIIAVALAGAIGLAGVMAPRIAWSRDTDDDVGAARGWCWGDGYGSHGPGMMRGPGMMGYGYGRIVVPGYGAGRRDADHGNWGPAMMNGAGPDARAAVLAPAQRNELDRWHTGRWTR